MITVQEIKNEDDYNLWVSIMEESLLRIAILPKNVRNLLNYDIESLEVLENYILENYDIDSIGDSKNKFALDLFSRYVGEVFKKNLNDMIWVFQGDSTKMYFQSPEVTRFKNLPYNSFNPISFVIASLDRRTGVYMKDIIVNNLKYEDKWYEGYKKMGLI